MKGISIVGLGQAGLRHLNAVAKLDNVEICALADKDPTIFKKLKCKDEIRKVNNYELIDQTNGLVVISLPHSMLKECSIHFLNKGNHVLIEKPMCLNLDDAIDFEKTIKNLKQKVSVSYVHRFRREVCNLKSWLDERILGKLISTNSEIYTLKRNPFPEWLLNYNLSGGGVLIYSAIHTIDMLNWLISDRCKRVEARLEMIQDTKIERSAICRLEFENGVISNLNVAVVEDKNVIRWKTTFYYQNGIIELTVKNGVKVFTEGKSFEYKTSNEISDNYNFEEQIAQVLNYTNNKLSPNIGFDDGFRALKILHNLYLSHEQSNPIDLNS